MHVGSAIELQLPPPIAFQINSIANRNRQARSGRVRDGPPVQCDADTTKCQQGSVSGRVSATTLDRTIEKSKAFDRDNSGTSMLLRIREQTSFEKVA